MKKRVGTPKTLRDKVLHEYRHKCAICGEGSPHLHHIDEDRTNNVSSNLLPLCPNCHLSDQHDPTTSHDPRKLSLFREYKDPAILKPQFKAIFDRLLFLFSLDSYTQSRLSNEMDDLLEFVAGMKMGKYYSERLKKLLITKPHVIEDASVLVDIDRFSVGFDKVKIQEHKRKQELEEQAMELRWVKDQQDYFNSVRGEIIRLIIESLRFQEWR